MTARRATTGTEQMLDHFTVASEPGNERAALAQVAAAVADSPLTPDQVERLKTAVAEATMNAIEHGNRNQPDLDVDIRVFGLGSGIAVTVTDDGVAGYRGGASAPDIDQKLAGMQSPRGWGLFLIENMVDRMNVSETHGKHTVRLEIDFEGPDAPDAQPAGGSDAGD
jgi:anti-sigma regulatory factor (Ser/Thr protein kinase)